MKRGRILILLGLILGVATMGGAYLILRGAQEPVVEPEKVTTQKVLVAMQNIAQAQPFDPAIIEEREFELSQVPPDALFSKTELAGKLAGQDIVQGQILRRDMLTDKRTIVEKGVNASFLVPEGKVAMAFPITELSSVAYALQAGDTIDMLITVNMISVDPETQIKEPVMRVAAGASGAAAPVGGVTGTQIPRMVTQLTIQDVTILKIGPWGQAALPQPNATPGAQATLTPDQQAQQGQQGQATPVPAGPKNMTVLLSQQDALVLKFAREAGASIDFVLRSRNDHEIITTEPVTLEYMIQRFNIRPPERLPYAIEMGSPATTTDGAQ